MNHRYRNTSFVLRSIPELVCCASLLVLSAFPPASAKTPHTPNLIFQTSKAWSPRINLGADMAMVYGINNTMPDRIRSWRKHGYRVSVMTGVAWGHYVSYLNGKFDGTPHWDATQQEKNGKLRLHSGRETPYFVPSKSYSRYLTTGIRRALNAGAEAIYLEEPEFWANTGWSKAFKRAWRDYYKKPWQAPDSSPDAQYHASKLKFYLYRRTVADVFQFVRKWARKHGKRIPCYVATHSLLNYTQWRIVSPEFSFLNIGADGYIAQVWRATSDTPNVYRGVKAERTFETAFLEYGAEAAIARTADTPMWFEDDPLGDVPTYTWGEFERKWKSDLVASLLHPQIARYEILPWPHRIFGRNATHAVAKTSLDSAPPRSWDLMSGLPESTIPSSYQTTLQTAFNALGRMKKNQSTWMVTGTRGIGVLVSDTMLFQRAQPHPSDPYLGSFYGLAMPLLMQGMPVKPVQMESIYRPQSTSLQHVKVLLLTYEGQNPPSSKLDAALNTWVHQGGALVVVDNDKDPYNKVSSWWNKNDDKNQTPRGKLFQSLGLKSNAEGVHHVGKGVVLFANSSPAALTYHKNGANKIVQLTKDAAHAVKVPWKTTSALVLRRGHFIIAAGLGCKAEMDDTCAKKSTSGSSGRSPSSTSAATFSGRFLDLYSPQLKTLSKVTIQPGDHRFLLDLNTFKKKAPQLIAASGKVTQKQVSERSLAFHVSGVEGRDHQDHTVIAAWLRNAPRRITVDDHSLPGDQYTYTDHLLRLMFPTHSTSQSIAIQLQ